MAFTPDEISQILEEFFKTVGTRQYIGARYVPVFGRKGEDSIEWDGGLAPYEPLTVVLHQGNSYTSRQYVPTGVAITDESFWAQTGNYNAQIEQYRQTVLGFDGRISANEDDIAMLIQAGNNLGAMLPMSDFSAENTVKDYVDALATTILDKDGFSYITHETEGKNDTSWFMIKVPRNKVTLSHANNAGSSDPKDRTSNAFAYAKAHKEVFIATNCDYGGNDYPIRLNGVNVSGTDTTRPYLAFDDAGNPAWFTRGTSIGSIPASYITAYACDAYLVRNGAAYDIEFISSQANIPQPRNVFGWDDSYYYLLFVEGRGNLQCGMTLPELQTLCLNLGAANFVNLDGGGSIVCAINNGSGTHKVNYSRDFALPYNELRSTKIAQLFTLTDADNGILDSLISEYGAMTRGHDPYKVSCRGASTDVTNIANETFPYIPSASTIDRMALSQFIDDSYTFDNLLKLPIPKRSYSNKAIRGFGVVNASVPANTLSSSVDLRVLVRLYRMVNGVEETIASQYAPMHFVMSDTLQRINMVVPFEFNVTATTNQQINNQMYIRVELGTSNLVVSGDTLNVGYCYLEVEFDGEIV